MAKCSRKLKNRYAKPRALPVRIDRGNEEIFVERSKRFWSTNENCNFTPNKEMEQFLLLNDDCLNVFTQIPDSTIDLIVTDPPYRTTSRGSAGNSGGMLKKDITKNGKVFKFNDIDCVEYAPEFYRVLKDGSHCYVMTNHVNLIHMLNVFVDCGFHFIKSLIWDKSNKIMGQYYMSQFEYILFFRKGKGRKINKCGTSDILRFPNKKEKDVNGNNLHDTQKPIELMKILIENSSQENGIVLDPFMGIGSTGNACKELKRKFIGIELDRHYYELSKARLGTEMYQMRLCDFI